MKYESLDNLAKRLRNYIDKDNFKNIYIILNRHKDLEYNISKNYQTVMSLVTPLYSILRAVTCHYDKSEVFFRHGYFSFARHNGKHQFDRDLNKVLSFINDHILDFFSDDNQNSFEYIVKDYFSPNKNYMRGLENHSFLNLCSIECGVSDQILIAKHDDPGFFYDDIRISNLNASKFKSIKRRINRLVPIYEQIKSKYSRIILSKFNSNEKSQAEKNFPCSFLDFKSQIDTAYRDVTLYSMKTEMIEEYIPIHNAVMLLTNRSCYRKDIKPHVISDTDAFIIDNLFLLASLYYNIDSYISKLKNIYPRNYFKDEQVINYIKEYQAKVISRNRLRSLIYSDVSWMNQLIYEILSERKNLRYASYASLTSHSQMKFDKIDNKIDNISYTPLQVTKSPFNQIRDEDL